MLCDCKTLVFANLIIYREMQIAPATKIVIIMLKIYEHKTHRIKLGQGPLKAIRHPGAKFLWCAFPQFLNLKLEERFLVKNR